jgi:multiple sugar transport system substrate-binding protein
MRLKSATAAAASIASVAMLAAACSSSGGSSGAAANGGSSSASSGASPAENGPSPEGSPTSQALEKDASLTIWLNSGGTIPTAQKLINAWAAENGVKVSIQAMAGTDYQKDLQLAFKTGKGPDLFIGGDPRTFVKSGVMLPLNDLLPDDIKTAYKNALTPPQNYIVDGKIYSVPLTINTTRMVYNKGLFEKAGLDPDKPPTTISEVESDCKAIVAAGAYCLGVPMKYNGFEPKMIEPMIADTKADYAQGGLFDMKTQKFAFEALAPAVNLYREAVEQKWAYPGASSLDNDAMRSAFAQGKIAMYIGMSYDYPELVTKYHTTIDWSVGPVPVPDGQTAVRTVGNESGGYSVYSKTKYPHAAAALLSYLSGKEAVEQTLDAGSFPVRPDVTPSQATPQYEAFEAKDGDVASMPSPAKVVDITGDTFRDVINKLVLGQGDIDSTLASLDSKYDKAYKDGLDQGSIDAADYSG